MSFLTEFALRRVATLSAPKLFAPIPVAASRTFTTSMAQNKNPAEAAKDGLKKVDRAVSDKIVDGIDLASAGAAKVKEATNISSGEAKGKAEEVKGQAKGKAEELKGKAKGAAEDVKGKL